MFLSAVGRIERRYRSVAAPSGTKCYHPSRSPPFARRDGPCVLAENTFSDEQYSARVVYRPGVQRLPSSPTWGQPCAIRCCASTRSSTSCSWSARWPSRTSAARGRARLPAPRPPARRGDLLHAEPAARPRRDAVALPRDWTTAAAAVLTARGPQSFRDGSQFCSTATELAHGLLHEKPLSVRADAVLRPTLRGHEIRPEERPRRVGFECHPARMPTLMMVRWTSDRRAHGHRAATAGCTPPATDT